MHLRTVKSKNIQNKPYDTSHYYSTTPKKRIKESTPKSAFLEEGSRRRRDILCNEQKQKTIVDTSKKTIINNTQQKRSKCAPQQILRNLPQKGLRTTPQKRKSKENATDQKRQRFEISCGKKYISFQKVHHQPNALTPLSPNLPRNINSKSEKKRKSALTPFSHVLSDL